MNEVEPRRRGRPARPASERRDCIVAVRLTEDEYAELEKIAKRYQVGVATVLRQRSQFKDVPIKVDFTPPTQEP